MAIKWQCWLILFAAVPLAEAQSTGKQAHLVPLSKVQTHTAAERIVASASGSQAIPSADNAQNFVLRATGVENLTLLPGELMVSSPAKADTVQMQCGLFVLSPQGIPRYLPAIGPDYKPYSWCEQLDGIGLAADAGVRPRLILIFLLRAAGGNHYEMPFILVWNAGASMYKVDYPTSFWLAGQHTGDTVSGARRLLLQRRQ